MDALSESERKELVAWRAVGMCLDLKAVASQASDRYLVGNRPVRVTIGTEQPQELADALFAAADLMATNMGIPERDEETS